MQHKIMLLVGFLGFGALVTAALSLTFLYGEILFAARLAAGLSGCL